MPIVGKKVLASLSSGKTKPQTIHTMETTTIVRNEMANGAANNALTNLNLKSTPDWIRTVKVVRAVFSKQELYKTNADGTEVKLPCITIVVKVGEKQYYDQTFVRSLNDRKLYKLCSMIGVEMPKLDSQEELLDLLAHIKNELNKPFSLGGWAGETVSQFMFAKNKTDDEKGKVLGTTQRAPLQLHLLA
jgi:hypothetical protein